MEVKLFHHEVSSRATLVAIVFYYRSNFSAIADAKQNSAAAATVSKCVYSAKLVTSFQN